MIHKHAIHIVLLLPDLRYWYNKDRPTRSQLVCNDDLKVKVGVAIREHPFVQRRLELVDVGFWGELHYVRVGAPTTSPTAPPTVASIKPPTASVVSNQGIAHHCDSPLERKKSSTTLPTKVSPSETDSSETCGYHKLKER